MMRTPVTSSFIKAIGHEGARLEVELANGKVYACEDCTPEEHAAFIGATSIGRHFNTMRGRLALIEEPKDGEA